MQRKGQKEKEKEEILWRKKIFLCWGEGKKNKTKCQPCKRLQDGRQFGQPGSTELEKFTKENIGWVKNCDAVCERHCCNRSIYRRKCRVYTNIKNLMHQLIQHFPQVFISFIHFSFPNNKVLSDPIHCLEAHAGWVGEWRTETTLSISRCLEKNTSSVPLRKKSNCPKVLYY